MTLFLVTRVDQDTAMAGKGEERVEVGYLIVKQPALDS